MSKSWKQLCLFCRGQGIICLEKEGDLGTYVDCSYCDAGLNDDDYEGSDEKYDARGHDSAGRYRDED